MLGFAECVLYKLPAKSPQSCPDGNLGTRLLEGVFLGFNTSYVGVVSCRSLCRKPIENRWLAESILQLKSTPWALRERAQPQAELRGTTTRTEPPAPRTEGPLPKAFLINYADVQEHGSSENGSSASTMSCSASSKLAWRTRPSAGPGSWTDSCPRLKDE